MVKSTFGRMADILKSNVNEVLDRIEDPEKMVRQMVRDMEGTVEAHVASVGTAVANQRRLEKAQDAYRVRALEFAEQARRAVEVGDDDLARRALERKVQCERAAVEQEGAVDESRQVTEQMKDHLHELRASLKRARSREGSLVARCQAARLRGEPPSGSQPAVGDPFAEFQRLESRIAHNESEFERLKAQLEGEVDQADAEEEIRTDTTAEDRTLDRRLEQAAVKERVDAELEALRAKAAGGE